MIMTPFASSLVSFFLLVPLLVSAAPASVLPRQIAGLPRDTTHLALDEETLEVIAFNRNGNHLGRYPMGALARRTTGACADMSSGDVQKRAFLHLLCHPSLTPTHLRFKTTVPGWSQLKDAAEKNWGKGKHRIVTNDKDVWN